MQQDGLADETCESLCQFPGDDAGKMNLLQTLLTYEACFICAVMLDNIFVF